MTVSPASRGGVFAIVRAFNEEPTLGGVLADLLGAGYQVVVVDDGSTDRTPAIASERGAILVRHVLNLGPGAALQTGMTASLRAGARWLVTVDADGQHPVGEIAKLLAPLFAGEADVVFGSRFLRREDRRKVPWARRLVLRGGVIVNGLLTGLWLTDAHNGFRAFTRDAAEKIRLRERSFAYASEMLSEILRHSLRIVELPVTVVYTDRSLAKGQRSWNSINIVLDHLIDRVLR